MSSHNTQKEEISQQSDGVFEVWKHKGETLADLVIRFRKEENVPPDKKITYAGRLDPMASGVVILLVGQARFLKECWNAKKKTYDVAILLGVETDTLDMLGLVTKVGMESRENVRTSQIVAEMKSIASLPYPRYSSRPVDGKPLFVHAREGSKVVVPSKNVTIEDAEILSVSNKRLSECIQETLPIIKKVSGDFRQTEIIQKWEVFSASHGDNSVQIISVRVTASPGTYMRSLAQWVGDKLGVPALAYRITRTNFWE
jgi:tRNA pseudouridine(55) synthase